MYKVVKAFTDLQDNNHVYLAGDKFPREGAKVSDERAAELASDKNARGEALIEAVDVPKKAKIQPVAEETEKKDEVATEAEKKPKKRSIKEK